MCGRVRRNPATQLSPACYGFAQQGVSSVTLGAVSADAVAADENNTRNIALMASAILTLIMEIIPLRIS